MNEPVFHLWDVTLSAGFFLQLSSGASDYSATILILSLLIITGLVIWMSYYYWQQRRVSISKERYRIKSARLIKNGRKYAKKEKQLSD